MSPSSTRTVLAQSHPLLAPVEHHFCRASRCVPALCLHTLHYEAHGAASLKSQHLLPVTILWSLVSTTSATVDISTGDAIIPLRRACKMQVRQRSSSWASTVTLAVLHLHDPALATKVNSRGARPLHCLGQPDAVDRTFSASPISRMVDQWPWQWHDSLSWLSSRLKHNAEYCEANLDRFEEIARNKRAR